MPVEIHQSKCRSNVYGEFDTEMFDMGSFFSSSVNINIIDSYTSHYWSNRPNTGSPTYTTKRYKGDPFATDDPARPGYKIWHDEVDIGESNDWMVIECQSTIHTGLSLPKWQMKIQWLGNTGTFADVSDPTGVKWPKNHGATRIECWRFAPWGGWDLADTTPDFNPVVGTSKKSGENHENKCGASGSWHRFIVVALDGQLYRLGRLWTSDFSITYIGGVYGDVLPVDADHMPMPRAAMNSGSGGQEPYGRQNYGWCCDGTYCSGNEATYPYLTSNLYPGVEFWDGNLVRVCEAFKLPSFYKLLTNGLVQPNRYVPNTEIEFFPYIPMPYTREGMWFSVPCLRYGWGIGQHPVNNMNWLCTREQDFCVFTQWDGSTVLK